MDPYTILLMWRHYIEYVVLVPLDSTRSSEKMTYP